MYLTVREASQLTGLSPSTVRRRVAAGKWRARRTMCIQVIVDDFQAPTRDVLELRLRELQERVEQLERLPLGRHANDTVINTRVIKDE